MPTIQKCRQRECPVMVMFCRYVKPPHKFAPIEVQPSDDGNVLVTGDSYEILPPEERVIAKQRGFVLRKSHFATCAFARKFAKRVAARKSIVASRDKN